MPDDRRQPSLGPGPSPGLKRPERAVSSVRPCRYLHASGDSRCHVRKDGMRAANRDGTFDRLATQRVAVLECNGCHDRVVVIEDQLYNGSREAQSGLVSWEGIHWWPAPRAGTLGSDVASKVAEAYDEGVRCLSAAAPNGAVAMFRTAMTWIVDDKGSAAAKAKGDLKDKVKQMVADGGLTSTIGSWVDHVRLYGNAGVHPDLFGGASLEEAKDVRRLTETLIELLYITPAKIARRQAERMPPSARP